MYDTNLVTVRTKTKYVISNMNEKYTFYTFFLIYVVAIFYFIYYNVLLASWGFCIICIIETYS